MGGKTKFIIVMLIFGSIGLFVKNIQLSSSEIALFRGAIGSIFLICLTLLFKEKVSFESLKRNGLLLLLSGAALGFNWIFLFEAYRYTTISNATVSYYFAPIFVLAVAPFILKERLTLNKVLSIIGAMIGLYLIMKSGEAGTTGTFNHKIGIFYGLLAALLYASVILMNKFIKNLSEYETTLIQLIVATIVLAPYVFVKEEMNYGGLDLQSIVFVLILGIIHTGFAYYLYFSSLKVLKGQTIAILSYIDPISAVIFSMIFLSESLTFVQVVGGILILGSTFFGGRETKNNREKEQVV